MGYTRKLAIRNYIVEGFLILASLIVLLPACHSDLWFFQNQRRSA
ncbi:hypothetical protein Q0F98_35870 [Paenibacillus amylolyticus]|nr:hypothetical protein Q0F98_35870 [Paenibacillus amylolyticus]